MRTGPVGVDDGRGGQLAGEVRRRVAEVDGQAADDERRPDDDRVADPLGEGQRLLDAVGHPALGLRDAEPVEERREPGPLLGLVDRLEVEPSSGTPPAASGAARLSGVWPPYATTAGRSVVAVGRLGVDDAADALRVERLEVEPGRGVEVGRDGLRVRVDHHRAPARPAERVGGLDRAVVELDPLPDPDRPGADDEGRRAGDRRRLGRGAGRGVGRVEVRRLGGELGGARVDHRVAGRRPSASRAARISSGGRAGQAGQLPVAEARRA